MYVSFRRLDVVLYCLQLVMTGAAVIVIDKLGRRPLLFGGVSGMVCPLTSSLLSLLFFVVLAACVFLIA